MDSLFDIQNAVEAAERKRSKGDLKGAYDSYRDILSKRLRYEFKAADLTIIQSLADLALYFGDRQAADHLLEGLVEVCNQENNIQIADYTILRRINLALERNKLHQAQSLLESMADRIGNVRSIQFSQTGIEQWEKKCYWHKANARDRTVLFTHLLLTMGRLLSALGQYADSILTLERSLYHAHSENTDDRVGPSLARQMRIPIKLCLAKAYLEKGHLTETYIQLDQIHQEIVNRKERLFLIHWLQISSKRNLLLGEFGPALDGLRELRDICDDIGAFRAQLWATLDLASILIILNQVTQAQIYLLDVQQKADEIDEPDIKRQAQLWNLLANARSHSASIDSPISISDIRQDKLSQTTSDQSTEPRWLFSQKQSSNYLKLFEDRVLDFQWYLSQSKDTEAVAALSRIKDTFQYSDSQLIQVRIKFFEGLLAYYQFKENFQINQSESNDRFISKPGKTHKVLDLLGEVRKDLLRMGLKPELFQVQRVLGWCLSQMGESSEDLTLLAQNNNELLNVLTSSLKPEEQAIYLLNKWTVEEESIANYISKIQQLANEIKCMNFLQRPWQKILLMSHLHILLKKIDRHKEILSHQNMNSGEKEHISESKSSLWKRLWTHPLRRCTLSFLVLPDYVFVVRIRKFYMDFVIIPSTRIQVRAEVKNWHENIEKLNIINRQRDIRKTPENDTLHDGEVDNKDHKLKVISDRLAGMLGLSILLRRLPRWINSITIVPDDVLHGFPFSAFRYNDAYLIEHYSIALAYQSWTNKLNLSPSQKTSLDIRDLPRKALLISISEGNEDLAGIPYARDEARHINNWLKNINIDTCLLEDSNANKDRIKHELINAQFFHASCHGTFEHNHPENSGLVLALTAEQTEILSLRELSSLDLSNLRHVTLSSCWAADHYIFPGRWVISLPETLWRAGAQSILGCLWEVYDDVATAFMVRFYHHLRKYPRDQALRKTQLECLKGDLVNCDRPRLANPIYWAGFNLYGNPHLLKLL